MSDESTEDFIKRISEIMFDESQYAKSVNLSTDVDNVLASSNNYYEDDITQDDVKTYYDRIMDKSDVTPISYGLNSKMVKVNGKVTEKTYKVGGMYGTALEKVCFWLDKAVTVAENDIQKAAFEKLSEYFQTGDLKKFDEYNILWVQDTTSSIDATLGFIEVYGDAIGYRGAFEAIVYYRDPEASKRIEAIGNEAQWFEDNSTI